MKMFFGNKYVPNITQYIPREHFGYENFEDYWARMFGLSKEELFAFVFANNSKENKEALNEKAEGDRSKFSDSSIEDALQKKTEESDMSIGVLRIVMRRGMAAWQQNHPSGVKQTQWGYARVNSFINKESGTWGGADSDLAQEVKS
jgi:hypothetical protein